MDGLTTYMPLKKRLLMKTKSTSKGRNKGIRSSEIAIRRSVGVDIRHTRAKFSVKKDLGPGAVFLGLGAFPESNEMVLLILLFTNAQVIHD